MDPEKIKFLIEAMAASDLAEMEFSEDGWSLKLVRSARGAEIQNPRAAAPCLPMRGVATTSTAPEPEPRVLSPMFGVVYLRPDPNSPNFVSPGMTVAAGTTLCIIEAMKVFNEVKAERAGTIAGILVASGEEVEAGQELIRFA